MFSNIYYIQEFDTINLFGSPAGRAINEITTSTKTCSIDSQISAKQSNRKTFENILRQHTQDTIITSITSTTTTTASTTTTTTSTSTTTKSSYCITTASSNNTKNSNSNNGSSMSMNSCGVVGIQGGCILGGGGGVGVGIGYKNDYVNSCIAVEDKSKSKCLKFKSNVIAKKAKFWKFLEEDKWKKNSVEDLSTSSSGKNR